MKRTLCTVAHPIRCVKIRLTCVTQATLLVFAIVFLVKYTTKMRTSRQQVSSEAMEKIQTNLEPLLSESSSSQKTEITEKSEGLETNVIAQQLDAYSLASSRMDERGLAASDAGETRQLSPPEVDAGDLGKALDATERSRHRTAAGFDSIRRRNSHESAIDTSKKAADCNDESKEGSKISEGLLSDSYKLQQVEHPCNNKSNGQLEPKGESERQPDVSTSLAALQRITKNIRNAGERSSTREDFMPQTDPQKTSVETAAIDSTSTFTSSKTNERASISTDNTPQHNLTTAAYNSSSIYNRSTVSSKSTIPANARTILASKPDSPAPVASFSSNRATASVAPTSTAASASSTHRALLIPTSSLNTTTATANAAAASSPPESHETAMLMMNSCGDSDGHRLRRLQNVTYDGNALEKNFLTAAPKFAHLWNQLKPAMTDSQRETVSMILKEFVKACAFYNFTDYFLFSGTLLGSYRHHGLQPWDDDIDILMKHSDRTTIYRSLKAYVDESTDFVVIDCYSRLKIFHRKRSVPIPGYEHKWPFVDISFYHDNETHIWEEYSASALYHVVPKSIVFPLHARPFEGVWMNSPRDAYAVLSMLYEKDRCITLTYLHAIEQLPRLPPAEFDCEITASVYPFVHRKAIQGCMGESLQVNGRVIHVLLIEEPTYAVTEPYRLKLIQPKDI